MTGGDEVRGSAVVGPPDRRWSRATGVGGVAVLVAVATLLVVGAFAASVLWPRGKHVAATAQPSASPSIAGNPVIQPPSPSTRGGYVTSVAELAPDLMDAMTGVSWRVGCPVPLDDLRLVSLTYFGFDGVDHTGELVVNKAIAAAVVRIFGKLYAARFPIRGMRRIDAFGGSDDDSMAADNTSSFNCRKAWGSTHWSQHAYGRAIDVNTVENPYLPQGQVLPAAGKSYVDRRDVRPGMVVPGDAIYRAFHDEGFTWGGSWANGTDYQHFEKGA
jgi:hypothetical protein